MKKIFLTLSLLIFFAIGKLSAQTVYVTDNGKKYHKKNCDLAKTGKKGLDLSEAKKQGYEPCKGCRPEEGQPMDKPKEKAIKK